jgi:hypothetical protein
VPKAQFSLHESCANVMHLGWFEPGAIGSRGRTLHSAAIQSQRPSSCGVPRDNSDKPVPEPRLGTRFESRSKPTLRPANLETRSEQRVKRVVPTPRHAFAIRSEPAISKSTSALSRTNLADRSKPTDTFAAQSSVIDGTLASR